MYEPDKMEFWSDIKTVEVALKTTAIPGVYLQDPASGDERYFFPISETVVSRPLWIAPQLNMWANILVSKRPGMVNRHYHPHPVFAYTISGKWGYLEHDWIATRGDVVYETSGGSHTLVSYEDDEPMRVFFVVYGPLIWLDEEGQTIGHYDVHDYIAEARAHYALNGIGEEYLDTLLR